MFMAPRSALFAAVTAEPLKLEIFKMAEKVPILVVLGLDMADKPHAARFTERDAPYVRRAAELMGFHVIRVPPENDELRGIAERLPLGKIFATGRAFVPFVAGTAFEKLTTLVEGGVTVEQRAISGAPSVYPLADMYTTEAINTADALWAKIEVGSVVLAEQPEWWGWWESLVVGMDGDVLTLRWMDESYPKPFHASRRDVALRHPGEPRKHPEATATTASAEITADSSGTPNRVE